MNNENHQFRTVICRNCGHTHTFQIECNDRTCPECQERRRYRIIDRFKPIVSIMQHPYFITLTFVRKNLTQHAVKKIRNDFTKLRHRKFWRATGGIYQIEVGNLDNWGQCNLHIHIIADFPKWEKTFDIFGSLSNTTKRRTALSKNWYEITGDSFIVDVKRIHSAKHIIKQYLTKHMAKRIGAKKHADMINRALRGSRLVQGFGTLTHCSMRYFLVECPNCHAKDSYATPMDGAGPQYPPQPRPTASLMLDNNGVPR